MKPKFKIDDIVCWHNEYNFPPMGKIISIGKVEAIHLDRKVDNITYTVSGTNTLIFEEVLYAEEDINFLRGLLGD